MRRATESDALIGAPEEIVERLKRLRAGGVEYVLLIDVGGSLASLRTFAARGDARIRRVSPRQLAALVVVSSVFIGFGGFAQTQSYDYAAIVQQPRIRGRATCAAL
jgi:hypothetical protein